MIDFTGRVALVTGGSRGIGQAAAVALARHGADVAVNYLSGADGAGETVRMIEAVGRRAAAFQANVADENEVTRLVDATHQALGPVDILVNNAGQAKWQEMDDITPDDWDETMLVNLKSVFLVTRACLPHMRAQGWGRIVNVSSGAAKTGGSVGIHYSASKGGVDALSRAYAARVIQDGVTVNIVSPSLIATDMFPNHDAVAAKSSIGRAGTPEECADAIVHAAGNGYMTGQTILLNGGRYFG